MSVKVKDNKINGGMNAYIFAELENIKNARRAMGDAILERAKMLAPVLTGELKSNGRVEAIDTSVSVVFGDARVPYARRRHFENRKNPGTLHYLERAGDSVEKEGLQKWLKK